MALTFRRRPIIVLFLVFVLFYGFIKNKSPPQVDDTKSLPSSRFYRAKILCWVITHEKGIAFQAHAIAQTWGKRCDRLIFITDQLDRDNPNILDPYEVIKLGMPSRRGLWSKTRQTLLMLNQKYARDYDWFLKADDDTYVIVENLKHFLQNYNPDHPWFFGRNFRAFVHGGYVSGGAGYVLSRQSVQLVAPILEEQSDFIGQGAVVEGQQTRPNASAMEDVQIAICLAQVGVNPAVTLDKEGRELFHPLRPRSEFRGLDIHWLRKYSSHRVFKGDRCCSEYSISFHYLSYSEMYIMDFALYHLKIYHDEKMPLQKKRDKN